MQARGFTEMDLLFLLGRLLQKPPARLGSRRTRGDGTSQGCGFLDSGETSTPTSVTRSPEAPSRITVFSNGEPHLALMPRLSPRSTRGSTPPAWKAVTLAMPIVGR